MKQGWQANTSQDKKKVYTYVTKQQATCTITTNTEYWTKNTIANLFHTTLVSLFWSIFAIIDFFRSVN